MMVQPENIVDNSDNQHSNNSIDLDNLQANILKSHGRKHCWWVFIKFGDSVNVVRDNFYLYAHKVTSAKKQIRNTRAYKNIQILENHIKKTKTKNEQLKDLLAENKAIYDDEVIVNLGLSFTGYQKIGLLSDKKTFSVPKDKSFRCGMKHHPAQFILKDRIAEHWNDHYKSDIDAVIIIAHDNKERLKKSESIIRNILSGTGSEISHIEYGQHLKLQIKGKERKVEHFGYIDGLSQPKFRVEEEKPSYNVSEGVTLFDLNAPFTFDEDRLKLVLVNDFSSTFESKNGFGTYMAFRKLEQNVKAFNKKVEEIADEGNLSTDEVREQIIGKKRDGTSLISTRNERFYDVLNEENDGFYEKNDPSGGICPFHAHVRKVNPRSADPKIKFTPSKEYKYGSTSPIGDVTFRSRNAQRIINELTEGPEELKKDIEKQLRVIYNENIGKNEEVIKAISKITKELEALIKSCHDLHCETPSGIKEGLSVADGHSPSEKLKDEFIQKFNEFLSQQLSQESSVERAGTELTPSNGKAPLTLSLKELFAKLDLHFQHRNRINEELRRQILIVRRGYPYGADLRQTDSEERKFIDEPEKDVGILFMSFQASITQQFEQIHSWANARDFPNIEKIYNRERHESGIDPIIGQLSVKEWQKQNEMKQLWIINKKEKLEYGFSGTVTPKGGEYFFLPSIPFLKELESLTYRT